MAQQESTSMVDFMKRFDSEENGKTDRWRKYIQ